jgi:hypothetical protein
VEISMKQNLAAITIVVSITLGATEGGAALAAAASAEDLSPTAYALVVGSNIGGVGQGELRYAEQDARRVSDVLTEIGGYPRNQVEVIERPSRSRLLDALSTAAGKLEQHAARGDKTVFFFYYSGHAHSIGLNLGAEVLPLQELREKLLTLPSSVVVAVLDACQSGAFSRVKGAGATADFSSNSVTQLASAGIAVISSSGASELSQESERLQSSFFTHHLLAGLRGAADMDRDGHVTLAEGYRYAYHRTLVDTSSTSVGSQHATLETGLRGKGEVVLTYPARAGAQVELPIWLGGEVLIERRPSGSVIAEIHKAAKESVRLALPPGEYRALLRQPQGVRTCALLLHDGQTTTLDPRRCTALADDAPMAVTKGETARLPRWAFELSAGQRWAIAVSPSERGLYFIAGHGLYPPYPDDPHWGFDLAVVRPLGANLEAVANFMHLDAEKEHHLSEQSAGDVLGWRVLGGGLHLRVLAWLWQKRIGVYAQAGLGLSLGRSTRTRWLDGDGNARRRQVDHAWLPGYHLAFVNGALFSPWDGVGVFVQVRLLETRDIGEWRKEQPVRTREHLLDTQAGVRVSF